MKSEFKANNTDKVDHVAEVIDAIYIKSGLYDYYCEQHPAFFHKLVTAIIPAHREMEELKLLCNEKRQILDQLNEDLLQRERIRGMRSASIRFWEREVNWRIPFTSFRVNSYFLNNLWDWILKIGLSVIQILSVSILLGVKITELQNSRDLALFLFALFSGISLTWMTSSIIVNLRISESYSKSISVPFTSTRRIRKIYLIVPTIWFFEAIMGYFCVTPMLADLQSDVGPLSHQQKIEIFFGVSTFAFINMFFALSKARMYLYTMPKKIRFAKANSAYQSIKDYQKLIEFDIENMLEQIKSLRKIVVNDIPFSESYGDVVSSVSSNVISEVKGKFKGKHPGTYTSKNKIDSKESVSSGNTEIQNREFVELIYQSNGSNNGLASKT